MNHFDEIRCCEYLDGALQGSERAAFERHLGECGACRAMIDEARRGQADLKRLRLREGPDLTPRIMAAVRGLPVPVQAVPGTAETAGGARRFIGWLSVLATAALAGLLFFSTSRPVSDGPGGTRTSSQARTALAGKLDAPVGLISAEGRWSASTNLTNGLFTEPTSFTTGSDGHFALTVETSGRIDLLPDSRLTIDNEQLRLEAGAVRCNFASGQPAIRPLNAGAVSIKAVNAAFGVRIASNTARVDLFEGKLTLSIASEPPIILTPGTRAVCGERVSLETLAEPDIRAWDAVPSPRTIDTAIPAVASETATPSAVIGQPAFPQPTSAAVVASPTLQPASATASPAGVPDDPLSTLLDHQPGAN